MTKKTQVGVGSALVLVLLASGAAFWWMKLRETPEKAWLEIRSAACDGDAQRFWGRIDWASISGKIKSRAQKTAAEKNPSISVDAVLDAALEKAKADWSEDLAKGKSGDWCAARLLDAEPGTNIVHWSTPSGKQNSGRFELDEGVYRLVDMNE